ncbi:hypothetical protein [Kineococcus rhizosphaerae]|uniref:DNA-directed RNA polymerase subunit beta n=1 Tax=Kineococcus rhizosphaerae TaxID=559628 RepID=A0A2T0QZB4_9ACTN|nr:hypothetical protein [Kineococcus rhizosphaerae]PRY11844.1 hypothetical protein CLV37_112143 [Kineococcus rhizosphaerae]
MPDPATPRRHHHRPALPGDEAIVALSGGVDPSAVQEAAHAAASALVHGARSAQDAEVTRRVVRLAQDEGLEVIADLWADAPADSLAGALWRLYVLRTWVVRQPVAVSRLYSDGRRHAPVLEVVAGVADPPGPEEVVAVVDAVLRGVAEGDFAVTLERAAAFCRVLAIGRAHHADSPVEEDAGTALTRSAARLVRTAEQLEHVAHRWRAGELG